MLFNLCANIMFFFKSFFFFLILQKIKISLYNIKLRDLDGIRTHTPCSTTPSRWRVYQFLQEAKIKKPNFRLAFVTRLGLEPRTPTLKVLCSTNWAIESLLLSGCKYINFFCYNKSFFYKFERFIIIYYHCIKCQIFTPKKISFL